MNVQYAIKDGTIYVLEVNPRASRTVPFVAKAIGQPIAKIAARIMAGETLDEPSPPYGAKPDPRSPGHIAVKEAVFPFARFPGVDILLGPEMRSTGEVMGLDPDFALAFAKSQLGAGVDLPREGTLFVSVRDEDKPRILPAVKRLAGARLQGPRHRRHRPLPRAKTASTAAEDQQGAGRPAAHRGRHPQPPGAARLQHHRRPEGGVGLQIAAPRHADAEGALLHDAVRRGRRRRGDRGAEGRQPEVARCRSISNVKPAPSAGRWGSLPASELCCQAPIASRPSSSHSPSIGMCSR